MSEHVYETWKSRRQRTWIHVQTYWVGLHQWPDASGARQYLSYPHRHRFHIHVWIGVTHNDRELEYFDVLDFINETLGAPAWGSDASCELMAETVLESLLIKYGPNRGMKIEVLEDGENGSVVEWGT